MAHTTLMIAAAPLLAAAMTAAVPAGPGWKGPPPRYDHVLVIVEENKNYEQIMDPVAAPNISRLAKTYGQATQFFAEVHPSEANYVALLGGDTFGIHDDDGYSCKAGVVDPFCSGSAAPGYVDHTVDKPHLGSQLEKAGLSWKGYYESIPAPGSGVFTATLLEYDDGSRKTALYASKHSGFLNFKSVQDDPKRADKIVGFDQLKRDIDADALPTFALVVPNQCNEMHGLHGPQVPADCDSSRDLPGLIRRGDTHVGQIVAQVQAGRAWKSVRNVAIVITFDEGSGKTREGCCGVTPGAASNFGGGHIPTIVITNHGPRGVSDPTPYSHYSLLRTFEDVFGIKDHLRHAADDKDGVVPMAPLF